MLPQKSIDSIDSNNNSDSNEPDSDEFVFEKLRDLCRNNLAFFAKDESSNGVRIHGSFQSLYDHIDMALQKVEEINGFAHEYDFDEQTPGNGYRSFVVAVRCCVRHSIKICRHGVENRNSLLFRKALYVKEVNKET